MPSYTLYVRDADRRRSVEIDDYSRLELVLRFNRPSTWVLQLPATGAAAAALDFTAGIVVVRDGATVLSGPVIDRDRSWGRDEDRLTVSGPDDTVWLARRRALPVPSGPPYTSQAYDVRTGAAETVMRAYIDNNAGPAATSPRRVAGLTIAADQGRGSSVTGRARFQSLLELLQELALAGGDLGFRIVQSGTDPQFQVYAPADRSRTAIFDRELGNLAAFTYKASAAEANYLYTAGGGEGTARVVVEGGDSTSIARYGRIEEFRDRRDTSDTTELAQTRDKELAEQAEKTGLSLTPVDTDALAYGAGYGLGDTVTVMVDGVPIRDVVREVKLTLTGDGETVTPSVGTPGAADPTRVLRLFDQLRRLHSRLGHLERR